MYQKLVKQHDDGGTGKPCHATFNTQKSTGKLGLIDTTNMFCERNDER